MISIWYHFVSCYICSRTSQMYCIRKTQEHIARDLLIHEKHRKALRTPGTLGILRETENHIFQGEISRYLQNQWLHEHGDSNKLYDNSRNGMGAMDAQPSERKMQGGFYEFNSDSLFRLFANCGVGFILLCISF